MSVKRNTSPRFAEHRQSSYLHQLTWSCLKNVCSAYSTRTEAWYKIPYKLVPNSSPMLISKLRSAGQWAIWSVITTFESSFLEFVCPHRPENSTHSLYSIVDVGQATYRWSQQLAYKLKSSLTLEMLPNVRVVLVCSANYCPRYDNPSREWPDKFLWLTLYLPGIILIY